MLDLIGTIGGNALNLTGILGLALGLMTRNWIVAAVLGALVGLAETMVFAGFDFAKVEAMETTIAILVGALAGLVGCAIRRKGTTV